MWGSGISSLLLLLECQGYFGLRLALAFSDMSVKRVYTFCSSDGHNLALIATTYHHSNAHAKLVFEARLLYY